MPPALNFGLDGSAIRIGARSIIGRELEGSSMRYYSTNQSVAENELASEVFIGRSFSIRRKAKTDRLSRLEFIITRVSLGDAKRNCNLQLMKAIPK